MNCILSLPSLFSSTTRLNTITFIVLAIFVVGRVRRWTASSLPIFVSHLFTLFSSFSLPLTQLLIHPLSITVEGLGIIFRVILIIPSHFQILYLMFLILIYFIIPFPGLISKQSITLAHCCSNFPFVRFSIHVVHGNRYQSAAQLLFN